MTISTTTRPILKYLLLLLLMAYAAQLASKNGGDFKVFFEASKLMASGEKVYGTWIFVTEGNYALYYYSPIFATLLVPFTWMPPFVIYFLWLLFSMWCVKRSWVLITANLDLSAFSQKQKIVLLICSFLVVARFLHENMSMVQMTPFLLWSVLESLKLIRAQKVVAGALLLAFAINIKLLPLVFIPYLLYRKHWKALALVLAFDVLLYLAPALVWGWETNLMHLKDWWAVINPSNSEHQLESSRGIQSITALIPILLTKTEGVVPYDRHIVNLPVETAMFITNIFRALMVLSVAVFTGVLPREQKQPLYLSAEVAYLMLLIPLLFPHQQKYAFFMLLPASAFIVYNLINQVATTQKRVVDMPLKWKVQVALISIAFIFCTLTSSDFIGKHGSFVAQHFRLITYGALIMMGLMIWMRAASHFKKIKEEHDQD